MNYINGTVDNYRNLTFEKGIAFTGEQNAAVLKINLGPFALETVESYALCLETSPFAERFVIGPITGAASSPARFHDGYLYCPLFGEMTETGLLKIQLVAYRTEGETEVTEKSSVAVITMGSSIGETALEPVQKVSLLSEVSRLGARVTSLEQRENIGIDDDSPILIENGKARLNRDAIDFDYFCAALCARLLFENRETTPVYFPGSRERATEIITAETETFDADETSRVMVIIPGDSLNRACLCVIENDGGSVKVSRLCGTDLLNYITEGVDA